MITKTSRPMSRKLMISKENAKQPDPKEVAQLAAQIMRNGNVEDAVNQAILILRETAMRYPQAEMIKLEVAEFHHDGAFTDGVLTPYAQIVRPEPETPTPIRFNDACKLIFDEQRADRAREKFVALLKSNIRQELDSEGYDEEIKKMLKEIETYEKSGMTQGGVDYYRWLFKHLKTTKDDVKFTISEMRKTVERGRKIIENAKKRPR